MKDLRGQRFGKLIVVQPAGTSKSGDLYWLCVCDCGTYTTIVRPSRNKSCGCARPESNRILHTIHGLGRTPEYHAFNLARYRCTDPDNVRYHIYGGRGIQFKFESFSDFLMDVGFKPEPKRLYSIDRIDNDGHYEPGNVRWATAPEQRRN